MEICLHIHGTPTQLFALIFPDQTSSQRRVGVQTVID